MCVPSVAMMIYAVAYMLLNTPEVICIKALGPVPGTQQMPLPPVPIAALIIPYPDSCLQQPISQSIQLPEWFTKKMRDGPCHSLASILGCFSLTIHWGLDSLVRLIKLDDLLLRPCGSITVSPVSQPFSASGPHNRIQPFIPLWLGTGLFSLLEEHLFPFLPCLPAEVSPGKPIFMLFSTYPTQAMLPFPSIDPETSTINVTSLPFCCNDFFLG